MTVKLTEAQVFDIHINYHANGGRCKYYTLMKRHGLTANEVYSVLSTSLKSALRKAAKGHKFVSWDPQQRKTKKKTTKDVYHKRAHMFGG